MNLEIIKCTSSVLSRTKALQDTGPHGLTLNTSACIIGSDLSQGNSKDCLIWLISFWLVFSNKPSLNQLFISQYWHQVNMMLFKQLGWSSNIVSLKLMRCNKEKQSMILTINRRWGKNSTTIDSLELADNGWCRFYMTGIWCVACVTDYDCFSQRMVFYMKINPCEGKSWWNFTLSLMFYCVYSV